MRYLIKMISINVIMNVCVPNLLKNKDIHSPTTISMKTVSISPKIQISQKKKSVRIENKTNTTSVFTILSSINV